MAGAKIAVLCVWLGMLSACKTGEAASTSSPSSVPSEVKTMKPVVTPADKSQVLLRWYFDRYSLSLKGDEAVESKTKEGTVQCSITENAVQAALGDEKLSALKAAIKNLAASKGNTTRNPIFRPYDQSRELVAYEGKNEFLIEMMYQAREVLIPGPKAKVEAFEEDFDKVMTVARDAKLCPNMKD